MQVNILVWSILIVRMGDVCQHIFVGHTSRHAYPNSHIWTHYCYLMRCTGQFVCVLGMVTNEQPGDPRASQLLTSVRRQSFAKSILYIFSGDRHAYVPVSILFLGHPVCICIVLWIGPRYTKYVVVLFVVEDIVNLQLGLNWGDKALGRILPPFVFPAAAVPPQCCKHTIIFNTTKYIWSGIWIAIYDVFWF